MPYRAVGIGLAALQLGAGLGAIAGCVRADRVLVMLASNLSLMFVLLGWRFDEPGELFAVLPWVAGCAVTCGWFTRHRTAPPVPLARWKRPWHAIPRPRLRRPTVVEIGALVAVIGALVIAPAIEHRPYREPYESLDQLTIVALAVAAMIPAGVFLAVIAERVKSTATRITFVVLSAMTASAILWSFAIMVSCEPPAWSLLVLAAIVAAIEIAIRTKPEEQHA